MLKSLITATRTEFSVDNAICATPQTLFIYAFLNTSLKWLLYVCLMGQNATIAHQRRCFRFKQKQFRKFTAVFYIYLTTLYYKY